MANWKTQREGRGRGFLLAAFISLLLHLCFLVVSGPWLALDPEEVPEEDEEFVVSVEDLEEPEEEVAEEEEEEPDPLEVVLQEPEPPPKPEEEPEEKVEKPDVEPEHLERKAVEQETNEEAPQEAKYLSDEANRVEEETRARERALEVAEPNESEEIEPPPQKRQEEQEEQLAMRDVQEPRPAPQEEPPPTEEQTEEPEVEEEELDEKSDVIVKRREPKKSKESVDPKELFQPNMQDYDRMFGDRDQEAKKRKPRREGRKILEGWEERDHAMRQSLENFLTEVKPGNHTGVNAHKSVYAGYIAMIHRKIHPRWGNGYLSDLDLHAPAGSPLNDPTLNTKLEFVIKADDGAVEAVNIVNSSGELQFDAEAVSISHGVGPHPSPPDEIISPDGRVYIHWNFWRDPRQCGTFGASVYLVNKDG